MNKVACFVALLLCASSLVLATSPVDATTYANLLRFTKFCSATYSGRRFSCTGYTLVATINISSTDTEGYIARDDNKQQIIVAFRGSVSNQNWNTDYNGTLIPYKDNGCASGCQVHGGFYQAWSTASSFVLNTLQSQKSAYPSYTVVVTGHSLGGALTSFASASILAAGYKTVAYSFGQPRVGNVAFANWMDSTFPAANYYRGTHTNDGVPGGSSGGVMKHHGIEYWQSPDPSSQSTTVKCVGQEDPTCNAGAGGSGINAAHNTYFGVQMGYTLCP